MPDLWERESVVKNLQWSGLLDRVSLRDWAQVSRTRIARDWRLREPIKEIGREILMYERCAKAVSAINQEFKDLKELLEEMEHRTRRIYDRCKFSKKLKKRLKSRAGMFQDDLYFQAQEEKRYWATGTWVKILGIKRSETRPTRTVEFDGWFQTRVGSILRLFLPVDAGVHRKTISSLIVLVYLVAGLAFDQEGNIIIKATGRRLEIANVDQNLKRAGIQ